MPDSDDRRRRIGDAGITLLASVGARGLTHRAADEAAGLPAGSTSYYARTRQALLEIAAARLVELDAADLDGDPSAALPQLLARWSDPAHRGRTLARYELFLLAARDPELAGRLRSPREEFARRAGVALRDAGAPDVPGLGLLVTAAFEGLLLNEVTGMGPSVADPLRAVLRRLGPDRGGQPTASSPSSDQS